MSLWATEPAPNEGLGFAPINSAKPTMVDELAPAMAGPEVRVKLAISKRRSEKRAANGGAKKPRRFCPKCSCEDCVAQQAVEAAKPKKRARRNEDQA